MKTVNYLETFTFPDIPEQPYPVYSVSEKGRVFNLKNIVYPNSRSIKKYTRNKQLKMRSLQAKIFDAFINIGYFEPLVVHREFPIVIQNHLRPKGLSGGYFLLDYYFPNLRLAVELDSDLHNPEKDRARDEYLRKLGITTYRIKNLENPSVQKKEFRQLVSVMKGMTPRNYAIFSFTDNIRSIKGS